MRLYSSFQMISCRLLYSTHMHASSWALLSRSQRSAGDCIMCGFQKAGQELQGATWLCHLVRKGLQSATVDEPLNVTAAQLMVWRTELFLMLFIPELRMDSWFLFHTVLLKFCFEYPTSSPVLPLVSAPALSLPIISFKCQQHTRHTEI